MKLIITPPEEMIEDVAIALPLSKSISTRALILDFLSGTPISCNPLPDNIADCDDTCAIARGLEQLKEADGKPVTIDVKASGAALRFLTAVCAALPGVDVTITGIERLCQRPMKVLVDALRQCGAQIEYLANEGFAPVHIKGTKLTGGEITVDATVSSQFISALMMTAPLMTSGLTINLDGEPVSTPYIDMTAAMMRQRGITVEREPLRIEVTHGAYHQFRQPAEADWSAAAFWYEISALSAGWITLPNLRTDSLQGDRRCAQFFECLGVNTTESEDTPDALELVPSPEVYGRLDLDLADNPDLAPALAVTCCLIGVPFKFTGLTNLSAKESDRLAAICQEMDKIGREVERLRDFGLEWTGKSHPIVDLPVFNAHGDHRMAMALAPAAIFIPGIAIEGAEAVSKSYPLFWEHLRSAGFTVTDADSIEPQN